MYNCYANQVLLIYNNLFFCEIFFSSFSSLSPFSFNFILCRKKNCLKSTLLFILYKTFKNKNVSPMTYMKADPHPPLEYWASLKNFSLICRSSCMTNITTDSFREHASGNYIQCMCIISQLVHML